MVRGAPVQQSLRILPVQVEPFGLAVGTHGTTLVGTLIPVNPQPAEILQDRTLVLFR